MRIPFLLAMAFATAADLRPLAAQHAHGHAAHHAAHTDSAAADTAFAALQARGRAAMGVDQYTSTHRFDALPDGGRIELQRDMDDAAGIATIRAHLRDVAAAFARGDFRVPAAVHAREVPGAAEMAAFRADIRYEYRELPRGAEVRIITTHPDAVAAIHAFMAFQRDDHRAGGAHP